jgi:DnaJ-class molecular chaperone
MTAFDQAWDLVIKAPRTLEELSHYEEGKCPSCEGTGQQLVTVGTGDTSESKTFNEAMEHSKRNAEQYMSECIACNGTGIPDDEIWGDDGVMEDVE